MILKLKISSFLVCCFLATVVMAQQHPRLLLTVEGVAEIRSASEVAWRSGDRPMESEKLTSDRSEHDIMLDLFCRRVAGGLIPVPDFFDVSHALRMIEQAVSNADFA